MGDREEPGAERRRVLLVSTQTRHRLEKDHAGGMLGRPSRIESAVAIAKDEIHVSVVEVAKELRGRQRGTDQLAIFAFAPLSNRTTTVLVLPWRHRPDPLSPTRY